MCFTSLEIHMKLPCLTRIRHERDYYDDGRRCNKWYLMDQHGVEHLAVIGEERDTRDGHYTYRAVRRRDGGHCGVCVAVQDCNTAQEVLSSMCWWLPSQPWLSQVVPDGPARR